MTRATACFLLTLMSAGLHAQQPPQPSAQQPAQPPSQKSQSAPAGQMEEPEEEDESIAPEKFVLNPLESERNIKVGNYYWGKGKFRAALERFERATKYNPSSPEAFYRLGEAEAKLKNQDAARLAFSRVVQLAPSTKLGSEARKKLGKISG